VSAEQGNSNNSNITNMEKIPSNNSGVQTFVYTGPQQVIKGSPNIGTAPASEAPRQIITGRSDGGQVTPQNQLGQNTPNAVTGNNDITSISSINITKGQAAKAEQEANAMIKAYYEELEEKNEASALATAQPNQSMGALQEETRCVAGEVSTQVGNSTVCLSTYEISIACNQGGSLFGDPVCSESAGITSIQQPGLGQTPPEEEEVIDETAGQGQQPGSGEEEVMEEGDGGEQEVIEEGDGGEQEAIEDFE
jgi:hypothetical protein